MSTHTVEEYLEAIYHLKEGKKPVSTSDLARLLGISAPSVTHMIKKLAKMNFIKYKPYRGVILTSRGEREAAKLVRRHRISERFLADVLGFRWDEVHDEACKFEHVLSDDVEARLYKVLRSPETCPHGNPIPDPSGKIIESVTQRLSALKAKEKGVVRKVTKEEPEFLCYLDKLGIFPGTPIEVKEIAPFDGPMSIKAGGKTEALGKEAASHIWVKKG